MNQLTPSNVLLVAITAAIWAAVITLAVFAI